MTKKELKTRETVERWLDKQIKINIKRRDNQTLEVNKNLTLEICGVSDYIQLYNCIDKIADILGYVNLLKNEDNHRSEEYYFIYKGVRFLEVK